jgi:transposase
MNGQILMREAKNLPPASLRSNSPYDPEAHYCTKNSVSWHGYKVHLTETCDDDAPRLITHVHTTESTQQDIDATEIIHEALAAKGLLPNRHMMDNGYVDAELLVKMNAEHDVILVGPVKPNVSWQAREGGYTSDDFHIDLESKRAICPEGVTSVYWKLKKDRFRNPIIHIRFPQSECQICQNRSLCTRHKKGYRAIGIRPQAQYQALLGVRRQQKTHQWKKEYEKRAGIEGTNSQGVRRFGLRQARYIGLSKTHLQHVLTAAAINIVRFSNWVSGVPLAKTRTSAFEAIRPAAA